MLLLTSSPLMVLDVGLLIYLAVNLPENNRNKFIAIAHALSNSLVEILIINMYLLFNSSYGQIVLCYCIPLGLPYIVAPFK